MLTFIFCFFPLALPAAYLFARHFDRARWLFFCLVAIYCTGLLVMAFFSWAFHSTALAVLGLLYFAVSNFYAIPFSPPRLHTKFARLFGRTFKMDVSEHFHSILESVYVGPVRGWHVGLWGAKGPPQANFMHSLDTGSDGKSGYITLLPGSQAYFEIMPETAEAPYYLDVLNGTFQVCLRAKHPVTANGTPHLFVCGGRYGCFYHREALDIGSDWVLNIRKFDPAQFERETTPATSASIDDALRRAAYVGVMWINDHSRNNVNLETPVDIDDFRIMARR